MVKTPCIQPSSPLTRTLSNLYIIPLEGVLTMAHMQVDLLLDVEPGDGAGDDEAALPGDSYVVPLWLMYFASCMT